MSLLKDIPAWVKLILTLAITLVSVTLAFASLKSDIRNETTERRADVELLKQVDQHQSETLDDIRQMLKEEFERHHPRR